MLASAVVEVAGFTTIGIFLVSIAYNVGHFAYTVFLGRLLGQRVDLKKCGPWAVVTGSTDGIGKSYAKALAKEGLNLVLISRNSEKLSKVAAEISAINNEIAIKTVAADFTQGQSIYPLLNDELSKLQVGLLVNNVGMLIGIGQPFAEIQEAEKINDIINCNVMSMARMCHLILPQMIERKRGVIINIGSIACAMTTPFITVYGATKAFVDKFSQDLAAEVRHRGILVQTVHPGHVVTNMTAMASSKPTMTGPDADTFVAAALGTLGIENRTGGYWFHKLQLALGDFMNAFLPRTFQENLVMKRMSHLENNLRKLSKTQ